MLLQLRIKNFAIIEDCTVTFEPGLVAMTGETGAGKSIIVDALSACLGARVGADAIRGEAELAEVEAIFAGDVANANVVKTLTEHGLEAGDDTLILAREIHRGGRSIGRVNGRAVPVSVMAVVGDTLADLHGQSEHLSLLKTARQLDMLDHFAGLDGPRAEFAESARELMAARERLRGLQAGQASALQRGDLLRFQVNEIESARLREGEQEELTQERARLANAEKIAGLAAAALSLLRGDDSQAGVMDRLQEAARSMSQLAQVDRVAEGVARLTEDLRYQAEDLAATIRRYLDEVEFDPPRLDQVESRLYEIERLERKYGPAIADVLAFYQEAGAELANVENYDLRLEQLTAELQAIEERAATAVLDLSERRTEAAESFTVRVGERLQQLGLGPAARFEITLERAASEDGLPVGGQGRVAFTSTGIDRIRFMVAFNAGEPLKPIERVASGGETARFMLAVKAVLARADDVPTLIFDEIDTGVGGRSGQVVGAMLRELGQSHQVISITHLAQIAAQAREHLKVRQAPGSESDRGCGPKTRP